MTASLNGSKSSSYSFINASHQDSSARTSYNFGIRSHSDTLSHDSNKKTAENISTSSTRQQVSTNSKKAKGRHKLPKQEDIKNLGQKQNELIKLMNVLLLNDVNTLINKNQSTEENIQDAKETISNTYTKKFHPTENNQRSFIASQQEVQKSIIDIEKKLKEKKLAYHNNDYELVSDVINLTPKEAITNFAFKKDDFQNTRIQF